MPNKHKDVLPIRNWVAKNQKKSGAGRHADKKSDYRRQPKHRNQTAEQSAVFYSNFKRKIRVEISKFRRK